MTLQRTAPGQFSKVHFHRRPWRAGRNVSNPPRRFQNLQCVRMQPFARWLAGNLFRQTILLFFQRAQKEQQTRLKIRSFLRQRALYAPEAEVIGFHVRLDHAEVAQSLARLSAELCVLCASAVKKARSSTIIIFSATELLKPAID